MIMLMGVGRAMEGGAHRVIILRGVGGGVGGGTRHDYVEGGREGCGGRRKERGCGEGGGGGGKGVVSLRRME